MKILSKITYEQLKKDIIDQKLDVSINPDYEWEDRKIIGNPVIEMGKIPTRTPQQKVPTKEGIVDYDNIQELLVNYHNTIQSLESQIKALTDKENSVAKLNSSLSSTSHLIAEVQKENQRLREEIGATDDVRNENKRLKDEVEKVNQEFADYKAKAIAGNTAKDKAIEELSNTIKELKSMDGDSESQTDSTTINKFVVDLVQLASEWDSDKKSALNTALANSPYFDTTFTKDTKESIRGLLKKSQSVGNNLNVGKLYIDSTHEDHSKNLLLNDGNNDQNNLLK